jgi:hypothetical protein
MADFAVYESLSREERLRRIGALFCKALALAFTPRQCLTEMQNVNLSASVGSVAKEGVARNESLREGDFALMKRFAPLGEFSPREATQFWGISRTSAYRRLQRLEHFGWLVRCGATNATRYQLTTRTLSVLKQVEQTVQAQQTSEIHSRSH